MSRHQILVFDELNGARLADQALDGLVALKVYLRVIGQHY